jgi:hypothetical protein
MKGGNGSQADILPQFVQQAAMRSEAGAQRLGHRPTYYLSSFNRRLCDLKQALNGWNFGNDDQSGCSFDKPSIVQVLSKLPHPAIGRYSSVET